MSAYRSPEQILDAAGAAWQPYSRESDASDDWTNEPPPDEAAYGTGSAQPSDSSPLEVINPADLEGRPIPERQWLVPEWIPMARVSGLYGLGGEGKTLLAQMLATASAIGKPWLGMHVRSCRSLLQFCEDDPEEMQRRQQAINAYYGCSFSDLEAMRWLPRLGYDNTLMTFNNGRGCLTELFDQFSKCAKDHLAGLIITDTLADVFGGEENQRAQARAFVQTALGGLARETGASVLALAHPSVRGKDDGGSSGSTGWVGTFRSHLFLSTPKEKEGEQPDPDLRVLTRNKSNFARRGEIIELCWRDGVFVPAQEPLAWITRRTAKEVFMALLMRLLGEGRYVSHNSKGGNYAPRIFAQCPDREKFCKADFKIAMEQLFADKAIKLGSYKNERHSYACILPATE